MSADSACSLCSAALPPSAVAQHKRRYHQSQGPRPCGLCRFASRSLPDLVAHACLEGHRLGAEGYSLPLYQAGHEDNDALDSSAAVEVKEVHGSEAKEEAADVEESVAVTAGSAEEMSEQVSDCVDDGETADKAEETLWRVSLLSFLEGNYEGRELQANGPASTARQPEMPSDLAGEELSLTHDSPAKAPISVQLDTSDKGSNSIEIVDESAQENTASKRTSFGRNSNKTAKKSSRPRKSALIPKTSSVNVKPPISEETEPRHSVTKNIETRTQQKLPQKSSDIGPLPCSKCHSEIKAKRSCYLSQYAVIHVKYCLSIRPYACSLCHRTYAQSNNLKSHISRNCPGGKIVIADKERNEAAIKEGVKLCFPTLSLHGRNMAGYRITTIPKLVKYHNKEHWA